MDSRLDIESEFSGDATGMQPWSNMSQEPSEDSRTSLTSEQRLEPALEPQEWTSRMQQGHRDRRQELAWRVQEFVSQHFACQRIPFFFGDNGQPNPAEKIAKGLVGQYLFSRESNLVIRILETEAYLESETALYHQKFIPVEINNFKTAAGTLVSLSPKRPFQKLVMTTGDNSSGDVVILKACELIIYGLEQIERRIGVTCRAGLEQIEEPGSVTYQRKNRNLVILGTHNVAKLLKPELTGNNNVLDATGGLRLFEKDPITEIILGGKRVMPKDCHILTYSTLPYVDKEYRFALGVTSAAYQAKALLHPRRGDLR